MTKPVVSLKDISVRSFHNTILNTINLDIREGDFVMLIGPNGSGKTSLMKVINGIIKPNRGGYFLDGRNVTKASAHTIAQHIATLTQDIHQSTFSELTVAMNLTLALERSIQILSDQQKQEYLATFSDSLKDRFNVMAGKLSGGQRQALALAMCFVLKPRVLLLDEHTAALDPKAANLLMHLTNEHVMRSGLTAVMISHNLEQVLQFGNRLIVLNEGRIVADLNADEKRKLTLNDLVSFAY